MKTEINIPLAIKYLTGKATISEKDEFELWLNSSSENTLQYRELKYYWDIVGESGNQYLPNKSEAWQNISKQIGRDKNKYLHPKSYLLKIAATIILITAIGILVKLAYDKLYQHNDNIIYVTTNNKILITLPDSSVVWLNSNSELNVPKSFQKNERVVSLRGEAFFEITKNPKAPFIINTPNTRTQVLGTSFNLRDRNNESEAIISVLSGKVIFNDYKNNTIILSPGQQGIYQLQSKTLTKKDIVTNNFLAWKTGKLEFKNASLMHVCNALSEYYEVNIKPSNVLQNKEYSFTGTFDSVELSEAMKIIGLTLDIQYHASNDTIFLQ